MKARPRKVENRIAEELNRWFNQVGLSPIERIPVLGRAGPDFTKNELQLRLDAKSRLAIPKSMKCGEEVIYFGMYAGVRLCDLDKLTRLSIRPVRASKTVARWVEKMEPNGGVILHWPHTPIKHAVLIMRLEVWQSVLNRMEIPWNPL